MDGNIKSVRKGFLAQVRHKIDAKIDSRLTDMDVDAQMRDKKRYDRSFYGWRKNELRAAARRVGLEVGE